MSERKDGKEMPGGKGRRERQETRHENDPQDVDKRKTTKMNKTAKRMNERKNKKAPKTKAKGIKERNDRQERPREKTRRKDKPVDPARLYIFATEIK